ncbi:MAG: ferrous iron transport protein B [Verrucomicrobiales bacterium]|nr:ferrous iron transport protein B [Verrucomicrobiales bacterium]
MMAVPPATPSAPSREFWVVLTGNPNCGKTTLFNALTGMHAKVGNYAGVTVERKEGRLRGTAPHLRFSILDLPGAYSLSPQSLDEEVARDVLFQRLPEVQPPSVVVVVVDASNLERNLYYATQVIELGYPTLIALNMVDVAHDVGMEIDAGALAERLGVPVISTVASRREGLDKIRAEIFRLAHRSVEPRQDGVGPRSFLDLPEAFRLASTELAGLLKKLFPDRAMRANSEAVLLLSDHQARSFSPVGTAYPAEVQRVVDAGRRQLQAAGIDWSSAVIEARYASVSEIHGAVVRDTAMAGETLSDRIDRVVTHRLAGPLIFIGLMFLMFQAIFTLAEWPMGWIESAVGGLGGWIGEAMPAGDLRNLMTDGVIAGVGAVLVFLPQILLLFLFLSLLEDTGYMARAAFLMDRLMSKVGLHGKSFIPLLSSFACAIPGIMATRTIETPKDRLVTILVAPLMSCSARLPVYTVLIAACIPSVVLLGFVRLSALTLLAMYLLGIVVAIGMAWLFKKTLLRGQAPLLIMELPPYKRPALRVVLRHMWDRSMLFLRRAGTVILVINMVLWVLATYPRDEKREAAAAAARADAALLSNPAEREARLLAVEHQVAGERLQGSFAGFLGRTIEPFIEPLGFDWKIGIGIVSSFAAREVFVSTMSTVYSVGGADDSEEGTQGLVTVLKNQRREDGRPLYTPLTGVTLMIFYVFALQCVSTIAIVRRETNGWYWPIFQWAYMTALAWTFAFVTYQGGRWLGFE